MRTVDTDKNRRVAATMIGAGLSRRKTWVYGKAGHGQRTADADVDADKIKMGVYK